LEISIGRSPNFGICDTIHFTANNHACLHEISYFISKDIFFSSSFDKILVTINNFMPK